MPPGEMAVTEPRSRTRCSPPAVGRGRSSESAMAVVAGGVPSLSEAAHAVDTARNWQVNSTATITRRTDLAVGRIRPVACNRIPSRMPLNIQPAWVAGLRKATVTVEADRRRAVHPFGPPCMPPPRRPAREPLSALRKTPRPIRPSPATRRRVPGGRRQPAPRSG